MWIDVVENQLVNASVPAKAFPNQAIRHVAPTLIEEASYYGVNGISYSNLEMFM
jgi:hypothetical protein